MAAWMVVFFCCFTIALSKRDKLNDILFNGEYEFIDLTYPFDDGTIYWPGTRPFQFTKKTETTNPDGAWYAANEFAAGEHGGTHLDAPYHTYMPGKYVDSIPLEKLIIPLFIADVSSKVAGNPNFVLQKSDLDHMLNINTDKPCVLVFKFGWSEYYHNRTQYLGLNSADNTLNFPGLSTEVAEWVTSSYRNVVGIGVDVPSVDPGSRPNLEVHKIFSQSGLYGIENVKLNQQVPEYGCTAFVLPMKIAKGSGAPLRFVAICPKP